MLTKTDPSDLVPYLQDASNMHGAQASSVVVPETEGDVVSVLVDAARNGTPVTVSGGGTGIVGGRLPHGGIVLSTERLNKITRISNDGGVAGAGVVLRDYVNAAKRERLLYAPDPTEWSCFLGGTVATNASGARTFKYGATRNHIKRLRVVLSSGKIVDLSRGECFAEADGGFELPLTDGSVLSGRLPDYTMPNTRKNASGYFVAPGMDLIDLFIGSEGTLGVVTEVETKLLPLPQEMLSGIVFFKSQAELLGFVEDARRLSFATRAGDGIIDACSIEFFDSEALRFMREVNSTIPESAAGAILFEQEMDSETEDAILSAWMDLFESHNAMIDESWFATSEADQLRLKEFRHALPVRVNEWLTRHRQRKVSTDMAVPDPEFPGMLDFYQSELKQAGLQYVIFGHIGDSHVHVNILPSNDNEAAKAKAVYARFIDRAVSLGGTVSAEHGIGKIKKEYLKVLYGEKFIREMAELKRLLDPTGCLGRDTVFSEDLL